MGRNSTILVRIALCLGLYACTNDSMTRGYPKVTTLDVSADIKTGVIFKAAVDFADLSQIVDHGFVWDKNQDLSLATSNSVHLGALAVPSFSKEVDTYLTPAVTYWVRAFVTISNKTVYGTLQQFTSVIGSGPVVTDFTPVQGIAGDTITVTGKNFSLHQADNQVYFNDVLAVLMALTSDSTMKVIVPIIGQTDIRVKVSVLGIGFASSKTFHIIAPSIVSGVPSQVALCDSVHITMNNLPRIDPEIAVTLNNLQVSFKRSNDVLSFIIPIETQFYIPPNSNILNITAAGFHFEYPFAGSTPKLISITPEVAWLDTLTFQVTDFPTCKNAIVTLYATIEYSENVDAQIIYESSTEVKAIVPENFCHPSFTTAIFFESGNNFLDSDQVINFKSPSILAISPLSASLGDQITIVCKNISNGNGDMEVDFYSGDGSTVVVGTTASNNMLSCNIPLGITADSDGNINFQVVNCAGKRANGKVSLIQ